MQPIAMGSGKRHAAVVPVTDQGQQVFARRRAEAGESTGGAGQRRQAWFRHSGWKHPPTGGALPGLGCGGPDRGDAIYEAAFDGFRHGGRPGRRFGRSADLCGQTLQAAVQRAVPTRFRAAQELVQPPEEISRRHIFGLAQARRGWRLEDVNRGVQQLAAPVQPPQAMAVMGRQGRRTVESRMGIDSAHRPDPV